MRAARASRAACSRDLCRGADDHVSVGGKHGPGEGASGAPAEKKARAEDKEFDEPLAAKAGVATPARARSHLLANAARHRSAIDCRGGEA